MLNGIAPLYMIFLVAGTIIDWNAKILPTYRNLYFENLCARTRAVEELRIWKREVKNKQTKNQESIRHFAYLNVLSSLEFISNEYFFSGSIFPGSLFLTVSTKCLHMHFSSLQLICPLKDVFPLLCFSWVWFFHMISGWVGDWGCQLWWPELPQGQRVFPQGPAHSPAGGGPWSLLRAGSLVSDLLSHKASLQDLCTALPALLFVWFPFTSFLSCL